MYAVVESVAGQLPEEIRGCGVVVAVSGGADSVALLRSLDALKDVWRLDLCAANLDHGLRGEQGASDAAWLATLCDELAIPVEFGTADVGALAESRDETIEEAARNARYEFLRTTVESTGARWIAVAHTADDQAETILHHIIRGTGIAGLRGMPSMRELSATAKPQADVSLPDTVPPDSAPPQIIRPLLAVMRKDVEGYLSDLGQDFLHDPTNDDLRFTRNRIRHEVLPQLRRDFHPEINASLLRLGHQATEITEFIDGLTAKLLDECVLEADENVCRIDGARLRDESPYLVRECFRRLWRQLNWPRQRMGFEHWQRLAELVCCPGAASLPGRVHAQSRGSLVMLTREVPDASS